VSRNANCISDVEYKERKKKECSNIESGCGTCCIIDSCFLLLFMYILQN
jgi:hypothetical protein